MAKVKLPLSCNFRKTRPRIEGTRSEVQTSLHVINHLCPQAKFGPLQELQSFQVGPSDQFYRLVFLPEGIDYE